MVIGAKRSKSDETFLAEESSRRDPVHAWISSRFPTYSRGCLVGMALVIPLVIATGSADAISVVKLSVVWWLGLVGWGLWAMWALCQHSRLPSSAIGFLALIFIGICGLATALSISPQFSLLGLPTRYNGLLPFVSYVGVMWLVVANYSEQPDMIKSIAVAMSIAGTIMSIYILFQASGIDWTHWGVGEGASSYPVGTMGNSNFAGGYLAISMPICLSYLLGAKGVTTRLIFAMSLGLQGLALWYTQTRGGMLGGLTALAFVVAAGGWRFVGSWMRVVAIGIFVAGLVSAFVFLSQPAKGTSVSLDSRTGTVESRLAFWSDALHVMEKSPLVGTGLDTFYRSYLQVRSDAEANRRPGSLTDSPHNIFLEYAANSGGLGVLAYLAVVGMTLYFGFQRLRALAPRVDVILLGLVGALIGYLVQGAFSIDGPATGIVGWLLVGCIAVRSDPIVMKSWRARSEQQGQRQERASGRRSSIYLALVSGGIGLAVAASLVVVTLPLVASLYANEGDFRTAMAVQPLDATYPKRAGDAEQTAGLAARESNDRARHFARADGYYQRALEAQPDEVEVVFNLASTNLAWAVSVDARRFAVADHWWKRALSINPHDPPMRQRVEESRREMERAGDALAIPPAGVGSTSANSWIAAGRAYAGAHAFPKARAALEAALQLNPGDREATELMAMVASNEAGA